MKVALLGTGLMGYPMAERLLKAGHDVTVYNRTPVKTLGLANLGAKIARRPSHAIAPAECIILTLSDIKAIHMVLFSQRLSFRHKTVIQMGTIAPLESTELSQRIVKQGGTYLECPVLGSRREAQAGILILMVGSTVTQFKHWQKFLKCFGPQPRRIGNVGKAAALKLALNQLIAALISAFALSLAFVQRKGVKVDDFMTILRQSVLYAPTFDKKLPGMLQHRYTNPNFSTKNMLKDVRLFLKESKTAKLSTESLQGIEKILINSLGKFSDKDYCALFETIRHS